MDTLEIAYNILYNLEHEKAGDYKGTVIGPQRIGCGNYKWIRVMKLLLEEGLISGVIIEKSITGNYDVDYEEAAITLKGAQYLEENSVMRKFGRSATNVVLVHTRER